MKTNETIKWQEEQALQRYQLIAPLLDESLDNAKRIQMREAVAEQNGLSPRTLYTAMKRLTEKAGSPV